MSLDARVTLTWSGSGDLKANEALERTKIYAKDRGVDVDTVDLRDVLINVGLIRGAAHEWIAEIVGVPEGSRYVVTMTPYEKKPKGWWIR